MYKKDKSPSKKSFNPRVSKPARQILCNIGIPESSPFIPDEFQIEAVEKAASDDVLVSAPTGSGKTWIAEKSIEKLLYQGQKVWYASPLKALSNAKYTEFSQIFGDENVGILTGDRKENSDASLIVGTTEILRNQLYDAMTKGENIDVDLVILDEAHYLADPERGVVWEEVIVYLPPRVRLLLLSATLSNYEELSRWMASIRKRPCRIVYTEKRPVPLSPMFLTTDGEIWPLFQNREISPKIVEFVKRSIRPQKVMPPSRILSALDELDLTPAIFFLPSRSECDQALAYCSFISREKWGEKSVQLNRIIDEFISEYGFLKNHRLLPLLRKYSVASHHAGHLPHYKLLVERLMQRGLLRAIFATTTVAAGVNFPARSVVLSQSDRYNGSTFVDLTASELAQMTGRAGRRGMDNIGFAIFPPGPHQKLFLVADLINSPPEPIKSNIKLSFSMVLNLLKSHQAEEIRPLLDRSLAAFQSAQKASTGHPDFFDELDDELKAGLCMGLEAAVISRQSYANTLSNLNRMKEEWEEFNRQLYLDSMLVQGRIIIDDRNRPWLIRKRAGRANRPGVTATLLSSKLNLKKGRLRRKFLGLDRIYMITDHVVEMKPDKQILGVLRKIASKKLKSAEQDGKLNQVNKKRLDKYLRKMESLEDILLKS